MLAFENLTITLLVAMGVALVLCLLATPPVKWFAEKVGAIDVPKDDRRVHATPIPRLGGLAIFIAFVISVVIFADISFGTQGILLGSVIIVIVGVVDDIVPLKPWQKFAAQILAALVAILHGVVIDFVSNPLPVGETYYLINLGIFAIPITILWIVGITNAVNLIDGLDGLAVGVSTIASLTMLAVALFVSADTNVAIILAALAGACIGFLPYNLNPAKIFMGDTGALLLGFLLSTLSIEGLFKFYAIISFAVPFMALALPIFDTTFAILRRIARGQSPMRPDRGHLHHRLLDWGFSHKQAVFIIYLISATLGLLAVVMTSSGPARIVFAFLAFLLVVATVLLVFNGNRFKKKKAHAEPETKEGEEKEGGAEHETD